MFPKAGLISFAIVAAFATISDAHDIYTNLRNSKGLSCCDEGECRPAYYRRGRFGLEMFVFQRWIAVPDTAIEYRFLDGDPGETNGGHWCGAEASELGVLTYCAFLPPSSAEMRLWTAMLRSETERP